MMKKQTRRFVESRSRRVVSSTPRAVSVSHASSPQLADVDSSLPSPLLSSSTMSTSTSTRRSASSTSSSSSSKTFIRHENEREEMISLNDRLAKFIDLVSEYDINSSMALINDVSITEARQKAMSEIREMFEKELEDARRLHAEEIARLERDCARYKSELSDLSPRLKSAERENNEIKKRLSILEPQISEKDARIRLLEEELNQLKPELHNKEKQLKSAKLEVENGKVIRSGLEKKIRDLEKDLQLQEEYNKKEIEKLEGTWDSSLLKYWEEYVDKLNVSLSADLQQVREQERYQETEVTELTRLLNRIKGFGSSEFAAEMRKLKLEMNVKDQNDTLVSRIMDLEAQLRKEREAHVEALGRRDRELEEVRETVAVRVTEYNDLLKIKLSLDQEIATYRALLEGGEARLRKRASMSESSISISPPREQPKPKRARVNDEYQVTRSSTTSGLVSIVETDSEAIKLHNHTDSEQSIGGWELQRVINGAIASTYTFSNRFKLRPDNSVTVWASSSENKVQDPPSDVIAKSTESWGSGDSTETLLLRTDGEVMARCTEKREQVSHGYVDYDETEDSRFRPCAVM